MRGTEEPSTLPKQRVVIVDDHRAIVEIFAHMIDSLAGFRVVGSAGTAAEAIAVIERERPSVIVLDLVLPDDSGLHVLRELKQRGCTPHVLIFSGNLRLALVKEALALGALGMLDKGSPLAEFQRALESVAQGQPYFGGEAGALVRELVQRRGRPAASLGDLTEREQTVLRLLASGLSSKQIAQQLGLSVHTVINHRSKLMRKTGLHRVAQLSRYAAELGLIDDAAARERPSA